MGIGEKVQRLRTSIRDDVSCDSAQTRMGTNGLQQSAGDNSIVTGHGSSVTVNVVMGQPTITEAQMADLRSLVNRICAAANLRHAAVWGRLKRRYHISAARNLADRDYVSARQFLLNLLAIYEPPARQSDR